MSGSSTHGPRKKVEKGEGLWLFSFSDMSMILLSFFVLMISTMKPVKEKFDIVKEGFTQKRSPNADTLELLAKKIQHVIHQKGLDPMTGVSYDLDGLHIEFKDGILFKSGSAEANPHYRDVVNSVLKIIARVGSKYKMQIEGHTDDIPLRPGGAFRSNWELSSARGFALMRSFNEFGVDEDRISVIAFAHTRPKVKVEGLTGSALKAARAANRRVVIWIE